MQLVINTFGAFLSRDGDCFSVKVEGKKQRISAKKVQSILISTGATITTDAVELAITHNIDIVFADKYGNPYGRIWHPKSGSITTIRRRQLELYNCDEGLYLALEWIQKKFDNQAGFLKELMVRRETRKAEIETWVGSLALLKEKTQALCGNLEQIRGTIMGLEGAAGRIYFGSLGKLLPREFAFKVRSRQPAKDPFNCLLNYGYGMLYSLVERACIIAGLEPYSGFIHTDNYGKKSLVFDMIECYRIYAERTVFYLFSKRKVKTHFFDSLKDGITLNKDGKALMISTMNEDMDGKIRYRGRNISKRDIIQFDAHNFAQKLIA